MGGRSLSVLHHLWPRNLPSPLPDGVTKVSSTAPLLARVDSGVMVPKKAVLCVCVQFYTFQSICPAIMQTCESLLLFYLSIIVSVSVNARYCVRVCSRYLHGCWRQMVCIGCASLCSLCFSSLSERDLRLSRLFLWTAYQRPQMVYRRFWSEYPFFFF